MSHFTSKNLNLGVKHDTEASLQPLTKMEQKGLNLPADLKQL